MSVINSTRRGCKDVFHAFLVKNATYDTTLEIPCVKPDNCIPQKLISFSKAIGGKDYDCFVLFMRMMQVLNGYGTIRKNTFRF